MKKIVEFIENKLIEIEARMKQLEQNHLYWLREDWQRLHSQRQVLGEALEAGK